ncbi:MAG: M6 family metalloprotease domain-containing protein [Thiovulaceae bacterium]|nr:M6 family metalloprotease domain-containing protein [Sulfurimonadaceae bacterium]
MIKILSFIFPLLFLACGSGTSISNVAPVADAGLYQYKSTGSTVILDGSGSSDANGDVLTYRWSFVSIPSGSSAALSFSETVSPRFTADLDGDYRIKLIVNDGQLDSTPAYVTVSTVTFVDPSTGLQAVNKIYTPSSTAMEHHPMLVIRLDYNNQSFVSGETIWHQILFGTQAGGLNNYYHEISQNQFEFSPVADAGNVVNGVTTVFFLSNHPDPDINSDIFTLELHPDLESAIEQVYADGFDFKTYDTNHNGSISPQELIITFIMAGGEDAYSGNLSANGVWAHTFCTDTEYTPNVNGVDVMGCDTGGKYAIFGERHYDTDMNDNIISAHDATVGIIAHELGHSVFSLPDLYDTDSYYGGIGYYGLMGNGIWGQRGNLGEPGDTPTHMCAWSKIDVGWYSASSTYSDVNTDLEINATGTANYNIIKTPISGSTEEYFLVENRGAGGYDEGLRVINDLYGGGIAVWHIDEGMINANLINNSVNDNASQKGVDLEEANAPSLDTSWGDPEKNLYYSGNKTEFTPNTQPNTNLYTNARSYIFFTYISSRADTMTLRINNPL